jgi:hypothetical protein
MADKPPTDPAERALNSLGIATRAFPSHARTVAHKPRVLDDMPDQHAGLCGYAGADAPTGCLAPGAWHGLVLTVDRSDLETHLTACDRHLPKMRASADHVHPQSEACGIGLTWWNDADNTSGCVDPDGAGALLQETAAAA